MFYVSTLKRLYESVKADESIPNCDKEKALEIINQIIRILVNY